MSILVDVAVAFIEPALELLGVDSKNTTCATKRRIWTGVIATVAVAVAIYVGIRWYR